MGELITGRLRRRVRTAGGEPLLTYYEPATGARVELSAVTLLNWVDKTSHLLDELDLSGGDVVGLALAEEAPGHWVTAVWELACWQVGVAVAVGRYDGVQLLVTGPGWAPFVGIAPEVLACSLHPLGLPLGGALPSSVLDYALEVRGQADSYSPAAQPAEALAWLDEERRLDQGALVAEPWPPSARRLVQPAEPWPTAYAAVVAPLLSGGSSVVVSGAVSDDELERIRRDERVDG
jgi:uncharacterized protein (TIGR03089 family)